MPDFKCPMGTLSYLITETLTEEEFAEFVDLDEILADSYSQLKPLSQVEAVYRKLIGVSRILAKRNK